MAENRHLPFGATVPFEEYEAEAAQTTGQLIGPDRRFTTIAAEASGRRAVRIVAGQTVTFVLRRPANAVTLRAAIPDSDTGVGITASLSVFADDRRIGRIELTSRYGWFYGRYPFTNRPADGTPHHFFDDARMRLGRVLPADTRVRFAVESGDEAPWYVLDVVDFERIPPPLAPPPHALILTDFGADPTGAAESTRAFVRAIAAARRRQVPLWIPAGLFKVEHHLLVDRVRILGTGPWYSVVRGDGVGFYGKPAPAGSQAVELGQFAILGEVTDRVDDAQRNAIGGAMGGGSYLHDLFLQHHKVGLWFDGPMRGLRVRRLRVTDCTADGLNFHRGVSHALVEQSFFRNTGDDALAAWSHLEADHNLIFRHNTVIAPNLANGIAIYGGYDIAVTGNLIADTLTEGGGLHVGNRFNAVPASGRISFTDNVVLRGGGLDARGEQPTGALWFYALDAPLKADIRVRRTRLIGSTAKAVEFRGKPITGVSLDRTSGSGTRAPSAASLDKPPTSHSRE